MILRTNPRHKKRQQNPLTILKRLARPHNLIVVAGVAGSGKTVLAGQLGADRIFDDLHYNMFPSGKLMMQTITDEILLAKNNNKKIVTCIVREMPSVLQQLDTAYFFVGVSPLIRQRYDSFIDAELLRKQERRYRRSCQKKRKQRPYLFVSKNTHHFGWFKFKGEEK